MAGVINFVLCSWAFYYVLLAQCLAPPISINGYHKPYKTLGTTLHLYLQWTSIKAKKKKISLIGWLSFVSLGHFLICSVKGCTGQGVVFGLSKLNSVPSLIQTGPEPVSNRVGLHNH